MKFIKLTNGATGQEDKDLILNSEYIVAIYSLFESETRIDTHMGETYTVKETIETILQILKGQQQRSGEDVVAQSERRELARPRGNPRSRD